MYNGYLGDPYNYPMPNRKDLMSLSNITPEKDGYLSKRNIFNTNRNVSSNLYNQDIECITNQDSRPKLHGSIQVRKPEFANINHDIEGSYPHPLHFCHIKNRN